MRSVHLLLKAINDLLEKCFSILAMLLMSMIILIVLGGAATRFFTGSGYNIVLELPPMLMPWLIFPMAAVLVRNGGHITVDFLPEKLSGKSKKILDITVYLICFCAAVAFCLAGYEATNLFILVGQRTEMEWSFPIWYIYLSFPVGFLFMASTTMEKVLESFLKETESVKLR